MTLTDKLAIIGAFTGTGALLWDFFKWTQVGVKAELRVTPNMVPAGLTKIQHKNELTIFVEVINTGDKKFTLTHLSMKHYDSLVHRLLNKCKYFAVANPLPGQLPHLMETGERWVGLINQTNEVSHMARNGYLYVCINHSSSKKTFCKPLKISSLN
jgi:hypothetical protein